MEAQVPRFSGALGRAPLVVPLAILVAVPALSALYAFVDVHCPIVGWFTWLFVLAFGLGLGWSIGEAGRLGRCRNPRFLRFMGVLAGVAGVYTSWAWFEYALLQKHGAAGDLGVTDLLADPAGMWAIAARISETGWYSINRLTPTGGVLWSLWAAEAVLVVAFTTRQAGAALDELLYCEGCDRWCEPDGEPRRLAVPAGRARARVRSGDVDAIVALGAQTPEQNDHVLLDVQLCPHCGKTGGLRLRREAFVAVEDERPRGVFEAVLGFVARRGQPSYAHRELLLDYVRCRPAELERLRALGRP